MRRWFYIAIVSMLAVALTACGSETENPPEPTAEPTSALQGEMTLGTLVWTEDTDDDTGEPGSPREQFTTDSPAIIVVLEAENVPSGTEFVAEWTINGAPITDATMEVVANGDMPHGWVAFQFTREEGQRYPIGELAVTVTVSNGEILESWTEIVFP